MRDHQDISRSLLPAEGYRADGQAPDPYAVASGAAISTPVKMTTLRGPGVRVSSRFVASHGPKSLAQDHSIRSTHLMVVWGLADPSCVRPARASPFCGPLALSTYCGASLLLAFFDDHDYFRYRGVGVASSSTTFCGQLASGLPQEGRETSRYVTVSPPGYCTRYRAASLGPSARRSTVGDHVGPSVASSSRIVMRSHLIRLAVLAQITSGQFSPTEQLPDRELREPKSSRNPLQTRSRLAHFAGVFQEITYVLHRSL